MDHAHQGRGHPDHLAAAFGHVRPDGSGRLPGRPVDVVEAPPGGLFAPRLIEEPGHAAGPVAGSERPDVHGSSLAPSRPDDANPTLPFEGSAEPERRRQAAVAEPIGFRRHRTTTTHLPGTTSRPRS